MALPSSSSPCGGGGWSCGRHSFGTSVEGSCAPCPAMRKATDTAGAAAAGDDDDDEEPFSLGVLGVARGGAMVLVAVAVASTSGGRAGGGAWLTAAAAAGAEPAKVQRSLPHSTR